MATRNAASLVSKALDDWDRFIGRLQECGVGDNFDLTQARTLIGVVVTPFHLYVPKALAERTAAPGLRSYSSISELLDWLSGGVVKIP